LKYWRDYLGLLLMSGAVIALDQWTKALVRTHLPFGGIWMPLDWLTPYARIVHWYNTGTAFGLFQNGGMVFTVLAFVVSALIIYYFPRTSPRDWTLRVAMALQLGGAIGNLIDRLTLGKVTDFISIGTFPVFNLADLSISVGVGVLLLGAWLKDGARISRRSKQEQASVEKASEKSPQAGPASSSDEAQGE